MGNGNKEVAKGTEKLVETSNEISNSMKSINISTKQITTAVSLVLEAEVKENQAIQKVSEQLQQLSI